MEIEAWIQSVHTALPQAQFVSLEPDDGRNALLAAYWWPKEGQQCRIVTYANLPFGKPEFLLEMNAASEEEAAEWALAALQFADDHRHLSDLVPGAMFASTSPHVEFSPHDSWVVGLAQTVPSLGLEAAHLRLYPVFASEVEVLREVGLAQFLRRLGPDVQNPVRIPLTKEPRI